MGKRSRRKADFFTREVEEGVVLDFSAEWPQGENLPCGKELVADTPVGFMDLLTPQGRGQVLVQFLQRQPLDATISGEFDTVATFGKGCRVR